MTESNSFESPLRIGILGAARIVPAAVIRPCHDVARAQAYGIAARVPARAGSFQIRHGITKAYPTYQALLSSDEIDAVYIGLPNGLHCEWAIRAMEAGKHVLCEKPVASNAEEARQMTAASEANDRRLMEAFHYRYHPLAARMREIVASGELGRVEHIETSVCFPLLKFSDIRYQYDLAGGATMDAGCYAVHLLRTLADREPEVLSARARLHSPDIDREMKAEFRFPGGTTGRVRCAIFSPSRLVSLRALVRGDQGELNVLNPILPQLYHRLTVRTRAGTRHEKVAGESTYTHQLRAFVDHVQAGTSVVTGPADAVANMKVLDAIYDHAGLRRRGQGADTAN